MKEELAAKILKGKKIFWPHLNSIVFSGIPPGISDEELERLLFVGKKRDTSIQFVNRKDAGHSIDNRTKLTYFNKVEPGFGPNIPIYINYNLSPFISKPLWSKSKAE